MGGLADGVAQALAEGPGIAVSQQCLPGEPHPVERRQARQAQRSTNGLGGEDQGARRFAGGEPVANGGHGQPLLGLQPKQRARVVVAVGARDDEYGVLARLPPLLRPSGGLFDGCQRARVAAAGQQRVAGDAVLVEADLRDLAHPLRFGVGEAGAGLGEGEQDVAARAGLGQVRSDFREGLVEGRLEHDPHAVAAFDAIVEEGVGAQDHGLAVGRDERELAEA